MPDPKRPNRFRPLIGIALSLGLLAGMFYFIPFDDVAKSVRAIHPAWFIGAMGFTGLNLMLRGQRWALLFRPRHEVRGRDAMGPVMVGLALNCVLPGRVGELARIVLGAEKFKSGFTFCATTVVGDRFLDMVTLIGMMGLSMLWIPAPESADPVTIMGFTVDPALIHGLSLKLALLCIAAAIAGSCFIIPPIRVRLIALLSKLPVFRHPRILGMIDEISSGLGGFSRLSTLFKLLVYSVMIWLPLTGTYWMVAKGLPGISVSPLQALVLTTFTVAFVAIPSTPGSWGVYEAGGLVGLALLGLPVAPGTALAYFLAVHTTQYIPVILVGMVAIHREGWRVGTLLKRVRALREQRSA